jgi:hypothetical protein
MFMMLKLRRMSAARQGRAGAAGKRIVLRRIASVLLMTDTESNRL